MKTVERQSNYELLRLVSLFLIMGLHANFFEFGTPTYADFVARPFFVSFRVFAQSLCMPSTFVFMMISGYFGMRPKVRSILNLTGILLFWHAMMIIKPMLMGDSFQWPGIVLFAKQMNPIGGWFIPCYLGVLLLSPVLNKFCDASSEKEFRVYLISLFAIMIASDHIIPLWRQFAGGYSTTSLLSMYLLGRYLKLYGDRLNHIRTSTLVTGYLIQAATCVAVAVASYLILRGGCAFGAKRVLWTIGSYTSPMALVGSLCLFLIFGRIKLQSKFINHLALSSFPIIGFHYFCNYGTWLHRVVDNFTGVGRVLLFISVPILTFCLIVLFDQIRILVWKGFDNYVFKR